MEISTFKYFAIVSFIVVFLITFILYYIIPIPKLFKAWKTKTDQIIAIGDEVNPKKINNNGSISRKKCNELFSSKFKNYTLKLNNTAFRVDILTLRIMLMEIAKECDNSETTFKIISDGKTNKKFTINKLAIGFDISNDHNNPDVISDLVKNNFKLFKIPAGSVVTRISCSHRGTLSTFIGIKVLNKILKYYCDNINENCYLIQKRDIGLGEAEFILLHKKELKPYDF